MAATHLNVSLFTLDNGSSVDLMGTFRDVTFNFENMLADTQPVGNRYGSKELTKKNLSFNVNQQLTSAGLRQTNLSVSVFTLGGTALLGRLRSGSLNITTAVDEASGEADVWQSPQSCGTTFELSGDLRIDLNPTITQILANGNLAVQKFSAVINLGNAAATLPVILETSAHKLEVLKIQSESFKLSGNGTPTSVSGDPLFQSILTGTAAFGFSARTAPGSASSFAGYTGNCLLVGAQYQFADNAVISAAHNFSSVGTVTGTVAG